jgi:hypothetical protein
MVFKSISGERKMKKFMIVFTVLLLLLLSVIPALAETGQYDACWGQASAVFA